MTTTTAKGRPSAKASTAAAKAPTIRRTSPAPGWACLKSSAANRKAQSRRATLLDAASAVVVVLLSGSAPRWLVPGALVAAAGVRGGFHAPFTESGRAAPPRASAARAAQRSAP